MSIQQIINAKLLQKNVQAPQSLIEAVLAKYDKTGGYCP